MLIGLDCDSLNINSGRRRVLVVKSLLCLQVTSRLLGHDPRVGVASLVHVDVLNPGLARIDLQVLREGARRERRTRLPRPVVPRPQWSLCAKHISAPGDGQVLNESFIDGSIPHFSADELSAFAPVLDDKPAILVFEVFSSERDDLIASQPRQEEEEQQRVIALGNYRTHIGPSPSHVQQSVHLLICERLD